jgi:hypothetical protein
LIKRPIGTIIAKSEVAIFLLRTIPKSYDGLVVLLLGQANRTISGVIGILFKEKVKQGESGISNLVERKILYIGKPS